MVENRISKKVLYVNLETTRLRGRPRNRWQDGRLDGRRGWKERVYNREELKKLLRTARNRRILQIPMEFIYLFIRASFNEDLTDSTYTTSNDCMIVNNEL
jgi:hypothetical protein